MDSHDQAILYITFGYAVLGDLLETVVKAFGA